MSYSMALGTVYALPETNGSNVIPNTTFMVDVPLDALVHDAVASGAQYVPWLVGSAWPSVQQQLLASAPSIAPALVDAAWPRARELLVGNAAAIAAELQPVVDAAVERVVPVVWARIAPDVQTAIQTTVAAEEKKAVAVGVLTAAAVLVGGALVARKMRWI